MKVYKRVDERLHPGHILSAGVEGTHEQEYTPGEWKYLKNMFVFDTLDAAEGCGFGTHTWECETPETHPAPKRILSSWYVSTAFNWFWSDPEGYAGEYMQDTPIGTLLCDSLLLIERVQKDEFSPQGPEGDLEGDEV